jgi:PAS domain S-box-containing protein
MTLDEMEASRKDLEVLDHIPIGICILRKDFVVIFWNRCLEDWTGILRSAMVGTTITKTFPHLQDPKYSMRLYDIFEGGPPTIFSSQLHGYLIPTPLRDGKMSIQHVTVTPVRALGGEGFYALLAIQDVTDLTHRIQDYRTMRDRAFEEINERKHAEEELKKARDVLELRVRERTTDLVTINEQLKREILERKNAEKALKENEEKYRNLFEESRDAIYITTRDGKFVDVNRAALSLFGYDREEMIGLDAVTIYLDPADREKFQREIEKKGSVRDYEVRCRRKDGKVMDCLLTSTLRKAADGTVLGYQGIFRDITERKKIEEELLRARKLESVGILAGGIAHDFNNLLTAILGNISLTRMYLKPEGEMYERLENAEKATIRAKDLTRQLLTFSLGGAPVKKKIAIAPLIRDSAGFALTGSNVRCDFYLPSNLLPVEVDEGQVSQVINNLVINACQAMPEGGTIWIRAENVTIRQGDILPLKDGNYIKITIRDQGIGIPEENVEKIFDPYFTTKDNGTGLGLTTAYSIIRNHHGFMTVESQPGVGTTFDIFLPASGKEPLEEKETERTVFGTGRVLVVDDEEMVRAVACKILNKIGYEAEFAKDGGEAIEMYKKAMEARAPYDIVIMDLTIPGGMGGKEAMVKLLELDPKVKAVVSSGYSNDPIMAEYRTYGFSGVVAKPYTIKEISEALRTAMSGEVKEPQ